MPRATLTVIVFGLVCSVCLAQENLCSNAGFEAVDEAGWAEGWTVWPGELDAGASVTIDDQVAHSGERSLWLLDEAGGGELSDAQQGTVAQAQAAVEAALAARTPAAVAKARGLVLQALVATAAD